MDWKLILEAAKILIWPAVVILAIFRFYHPLSKFIAGLGQRITKLSTFEVSIELAALPTPPSWTNSDLPQGAELPGSDVTSTSLMMLVQRIKEDKSWDYLVVDIKDGKFWFVSRLFIYMILLEAIRGLKCIVFVKSTDEYRRRLLGLASPKEVRVALGQAFPWLETALKKSSDKYPSSILYPEVLSANAANTLTAFIEDSEIQTMVAPDESLKQEWRHLSMSNKWEHTYWLDLSITKVSEAVTKCFYEKDASRYTDDPTVSNEERTRALVTRKAPFIALVNSQGEFKSLLDRQKLVALVGETLVKP